MLLTYTSPTNSPQLHNSAFKIRPRSLYKTPAYRASYSTCQPTTLYTLSFGPRLGLTMLRSDVCALHIWSSTPHQSSSCSLRSLRLRHCMHALRKHASPSPQGKSKPVGQWRTKACLTLTCGRSYRQREPCVRNEQRAMRTFRARQVSCTCFEVSGSPHDRRKRRLGKRNPVGQIQILHKHCVGRCPT